MGEHHDYQQIMTSLRRSYNQENKTVLLEIGAGTGHDSLFFQNNGLDVVCTDLSADMVNRCRAKGLTAYVMDVLNLDFPPRTFDAVYALNCLHHVPTHDLPAVLHKLWSLLRSGGLFFLCVYGGREWEGVREHDWHQPPRFFAYHTDTFMQHITAPLFDLISFHTLPSEEHPLYFQCLTLRAKQAMEGTQAGDALAFSVRNAPTGEEEVR